MRTAVDASIAESLAALRRDRLDCLLLHRASHMTAFGGAVWERLIERLEDGSVVSLGVSVQSPLEALMALANPDVVHLQLPFNILDWRWREAGFQNCLAARPNVTIHARSTFLQGILAANDPSVWPRIEDVSADALVKLIAYLAWELKRDNAADLCLAYARGQDWIDGVVVGLETEEQLEKNLGLFVKRPLTARGMPARGDLHPAPADPASQSRALAPMSDPVPPRRARRLRLRRGRDIWAAPCRARCARRARM